MVFMKKMMRRGLGLLVLLIAFQSCNQSIEETTLAEKISKNPTFIDLIENRYLAVNYSCEGDLGENINVDKLKESFELPADERDLVLEEILSKKQHAFLKMSFAYVTLIESYPELLTLDVKEQNDQLALARGFIDWKEPSLTNNVFSPIDENRFEDVDCLAFATEQTLPFVILAELFCSFTQNPLICYFLDLVVESIFDSLFYTCNCMFYGDCGP